MLHDNVFSKEYWEKEAVHNGFFAILSQEQYRNPETFWKSGVGFTPELSKIITKDDSFLDIGCGYGRMCGHVASLVQSYNGVDFSKEMIAKAKEFHKSVPNANFFNNNGKDLSIFSDESFSIVYSCLLFQHLPKETIFEYLRETSRVLTDNGNMMIYHIPVSTMFTNGLTKEELNLACVNFKNLEVVETPHYYDIKGNK